MKLIDVSRELCASVGELTFGPPVTHVYNPLSYARAPHEQYLKRFGGGSKEIVFFGMNPGPWGMSQTGVPFGEVGLVRDWLGVSAHVARPDHEHPKRAILGFGCTRSEVSGARIWGWARDRFGTPERFFERCFIANYCPLAFLEASGKNRTPDKLPRSERDALEAVCDRAMREAVSTLKPSWVIGIGAFAEERARHALKDAKVRIGAVLHPSPASPRANRGWAREVEVDLRKLGIVI